MRAALHCGSLAFDGRIDVARRQRVSLEQTPDGFRVGIRLYQTLRVRGRFGAVEMGRFSVRAVGECGETQANSPTEILSRSRLHA